MSADPDAVSVLIQKDQGLLVRIARLCDRHGVAVTELLHVALDDLEGRASVERPEPDSDEEAYAEQYRLHYGGEGHRLTNPQWEEARLRDDVMVIPPDSVTQLDNRSSYCNTTGEIAYLLRHGDDEFVVIERYIRPLPAPENDRLRRGDL